MRVIKVLYFVISLPVVLLGISYHLTRLDLMFGKKIALELWGQIR